MNYKMIMSAIMIITIMSATSAIECQQDDGRIGWITWCWYYSVYINANFDALTAWKRDRRNSALNLLKYVRVCKDESTKKHLKQTAKENET